MQIYIDADYKCHAMSGEGLRAFEVSALDGKCPTYIEGMRYIPFGEIWTWPDGTVFSGEMLAPWKNEPVLAAVQGAYEDAMAASEQKITELQLAWAESFEAQEQTNTDLQLALAEMYESAGTTTEGAV